MRFSLLLAIAATAAGDYVVGTYYGFNKNCSGPVTYKEYDAECVPSSDFFDEKSGSVFATDGSWLKPSCQGEHMAKVDIFQGPGCTGRPKAKGIRIPATYDGAPAFGCAAHKNYNNLGSDGSVGSVHWKCVKGAHPKTFKGVNVDNYVGEHCRGSALKSDAAKYYALTNVFPPLASPLRAGAKPFKCTPNTIPANLPGSVGYSACTKAKGVKEYWFEESETCSGAFTGLAVEYAANECTTCDPTGPNAAPSCVGYTQVYRCNA